MALQGWEGSAGMGREQRAQTEGCSSLEGVQQQHQALMSQAQALHLPHLLELLTPAGTSLRGAAFSGPPGPVINPPAMVPSHESPTCTELSSCSGLEGALTPQLSYLSTTAFFQFGCPKNINVLSTNSIDLNILNI